MADSSSFDFLNGRPKTGHPNIQRFMDYMDSLIVDGEPPSKADLRPEKIGPLLQSVLLYHLHPEQNAFMCVLAGQKLNDVWGGNIAGRFLHDLFDENLVIHLETCWREAIRLKAIIHTIGHATAAASSIERLLLPLYDSERQLTYIYGITEYEALPTYELHDMQDGIVVQSTLYAM